MMTNHLSVSSGLCLIVLYQDPIQRKHFENFDVTTWMSVKINIVFLIKNVLLLRCSENGNPNTLWLALDSKLTVVLRSPIIIFIIMIIIIIIAKNSHQFKLVVFKCIYKTIYIYIYIYIYTRINCHFLIRSHEDGSLGAKSTWETIRHLKKKLIYPNHKRFAWTCEPIKDWRSIQ